MATAMPGRSASPALHDRRLGGKLRRPAAQGDLGAASMRGRCCSTSSGRSSPGGHTAAGRIGRTPRRSRRSGEIELCAESHELPGPFCPAADQGRLPARPVAARRSAPTTGGSWSMPRAGSVSPATACGSARTSCAASPSTRRSWWPGGGPRGARFPSRRRSPPLAAGFRRASRRASCRRPPPPPTACAATHLLSTSASPWCAQTAAGPRDCSGTRTACSLLPRLPGSHFLPSLPGEHRLVVTDDLGRSDRVVYRVE